MTSTDLQPFVRLLEEGIGLDAASIGHDEVGRAVRARLASHGGRHTEPIDAGRLREYLRRLLADQDERDAFVEHVLVPETWFFREPTAFELLKRVVSERVSAGRRCRVLSVPCATGEEPYSMAIALHEEGLVSDRIDIEALDISRRALDRAARATYGARAVRHVGATGLARYFAPGGDGHVVNPAIRDLVSFERDNLVAPEVLTRRRYNVIFCRNVLIYFTVAARARVLESLEAALADDGWLVTGHAESSGVVAPRFVSARVPRTFAYRKAPAEPPAVLVSPGHDDRGGGEPGRSVARRVESGTPPQAPPRPRTTTGPRSAPSLPVPAAERPPSLSEIERMADAGEFVRAVEMCGTHLAASPGSSEGYYLLGVIESARGNRASADAALRRAIYLDPGHVAALQYLANERQRGGDQREAAQLSRRADLVRARQK